MAANNAHDRVGEELTADVKVGQRDGVVTVLKGGMHDPEVVYKGFSEKAECDVHNGGHATIKPEIPVGTANLGMEEAHFSYTHVQD